jgi:hypothetical protein
MLLLKVEGLLVPAGIEAQAVWGLLHTGSRHHLQPFKRPQRISIGPSCWAAASASACAPAFARGRACVCGCVYACTHARTHARIYISLSLALSLTLTLTRSRPARCLKLASACVLCERLISCGGARAGHLPAAFPALLSFPKEGEAAEWRPPDF